MAKPTISIFTYTGASGRPFNVRSLISYVDPDGNPAVEWKFEDNTSSKDSGYFTVNGRAQSQGARFTVSNRDYFNVQFVPGATDTVDDVRVFVTDSRGETSGWWVGRWGAISFDYSVKARDDVKEGQDLVFRVTRSGGDTSIASSVFVKTSDVDATAGQDYIALPMTELKFAARQTTADVVVKTLSDKRTEKTESVYLNLFKKSTDNSEFKSATGKIIDDVSGNYTYKIITSSDAFSTTYIEGQKIPITIVRSGGDTKAPSTIYLSTVPWSGLAKQAREGQDFVAKNFEKIDFAAGTNPSAKLTPTIELVKDNIKESDEFLDINLYTTDKRPTIDDIADTRKFFIIDEPNYTYSLRTNGSSKEGDKLTFVVTRSGGVSTESTVFASTSAGSASQGADFEPLSFVPILFRRNAATATIEVNLKTDLVVEGNENFTLFLTSEKTSSSRLAEAQGIIVDTTLPPPAPAPRWKEINDIKYEGFDYTKALGASESASKWKFITVNESNNNRSVEGSDFKVTFYRGEGDALKEKLNDGKPVYVYTHGWKDAGYPSKVSKFVFEKLTEKLKESGGGHVVIVDWQNLADPAKNGANSVDQLDQPLYKIFGEPQPEITASVTRQVGESVAYALVKECGVDPSNLTFIGHSLGSFVSTSAAEFAKEFSGGKLVKEVVALDPAYKGKQALTLEERIEAAKAGPGGGSLKILGNFLWFEEGKYDLDARFGGVQEPSFFSKGRAQTTSSYVVSDAYGFWAIAGSNTLASQADNAYLVNFTKHFNYSSFDQQPVTNLHGGTVATYASLFNKAMLHPGDAGIGYGRNSISNKGEIGPNKGPFDGIVLTQLPWIGNPQDRWNVESIGWVEPNNSTTAIYGSRKDGNTLFFNNFVYSFNKTLAPDNFQAFTKDNIYDLNWFSMPVALYGGPVGTNNFVAGVHKDYSFGQRSKDFFIADPSAPQNNFWFGYRDMTGFNTVYDEKKGGASGLLNAYGQDDFVTIVGFNPAKDRIVLPWSKNSDQHYIFITPVKDNSLVGKDLYGYDLFGNFGEGSAIHVGFKNNNSSDLLAFVPGLSDGQALKALDDGTFIFGTYADLLYGNTGPVKLEPLYWGSA